MWTQDVNRHNLHYYISRTGSNIKLTSTNLENSYVPCARRSGVLDWVYFILHFEQVNFLNLPTRQITWKKQSWFKKRGGDNQFPSRGLQIWWRCWNRKAHIWLGILFMFLSCCLVISSFKMAINHTIGILVSISDCKTTVIFLGIQCRYVIGHMQEWDNFTVCGFSVNQSTTNMK